jgi:hypothetical protein
LFRAGHFRAVAFRRGVTGFGTYALLVERQKPAPTSPNPLDEPTWLTEGVRLDARA